MIVVKVINNTNNPITYPGESLTVPALTTVIAPNTILNGLLFDGSFISDINAQNISLSDGTNIYSGAVAIQYLQNSAIAVRGQGSLSLSGSGTNLNDILFTGDISGLILAYVTVTVTNNFSGPDAVATLAFEGSTDGIHWFSLPNNSPGGIGLSPTSSLVYTSSGTFIDPTILKVRLWGKYFRARIDYYTGTVGAWTVNASAYAVATDSVEPQGLMLVQPLTPGGSSSYGPQTTANSWSVSMASDQTPIPVNQQNIDTGTAIDSVTLGSTAAGSTQQNLYGTGGVFTVVTSGVSGTLPTLTAQLQYSYDGGTGWANIPGAVTGTISSNATTSLQVFPGAVTTSNQSVSWVVPKFWRLNYTIGGTSPSFTIKSYVCYV